jgi:uncharacterized protein (DUF433 family)
MPDMKTPVVVRDKNVLGGRTVFRGTRVQADILFQSLADGSSLKEVAESFPTLNMDDLKTALLQAGEMLIADAPPDQGQSRAGKKLHAHLS